MSTRIWKTGLLLGGMAVSFWVGFTGCGTSKVPVYCRTVCDCTGCAESVRDQCEASMEDAQKVAEDKGCTAEYNAAVQCVIEDAECVKDQLVTTACETENAAYEKCAGPIGIGKDACQKYEADIYERLSCLDFTSTGGSTSAECTPDQAKLATCLDACLDFADCPCIKDPTGAGCADKNQQYSDCASACTQ